MANREESGKQISPDVVNRIALAQGDPNIQGQGGPGWFGPGHTLRPVAPEEVAGRQLDFPTNYNINIKPRSYESVSFAMLRQLADSYDLLRLVIETRKDQIESYEWEIVSEEGKSVPDSTLDNLTTFFKYPDKENQWNTWIRKLLEDMFVIDAVAVYPRMTRGGEIYGFELMDGATIKRVIDEWGRRPLPPDPAYQQVLKGLPAVDYTSEELVYWMRNPRTNRIYGFSPVEQIIMTVNIALRRQVHQLQYYTEGNVPEAICGLPAEWGLDVIKQWQSYWDTTMEGNTAQRRHMKFVPFDPTKIFSPKSESLKDAYDEWLARIVCFCFSISPSQLVKETNRATADTVQDTAKKEGLVPLQTWIKNSIDYLIKVQLKQPNACFKWKAQLDLDPLQQAQVDQIYLAADVITPDEVRDRLGKEAMSEQQKRDLASRKAASLPPAVPMDGDKGKDDMKDAAIGKNPPVGGKVVEDPKQKDEELE